jgi:hypothetical protein
MLRLILQLFHGCPYRFTFGLGYLSATEHSDSEQFCSPLQRTEGYKQANPMIKKG